MAPRDRFVRWFEASGKSRIEVAHDIGCSDAFVGYLLAGKRDRPGLDLAFSIQRVTSDWDEGPILAEEWARDIGEHDEPSADDEAA